VIGSRFRVQTRPGAVGFVNEIVFTVNGFGLPSLHLNIPGLDQGFKGYKILNSITLYSIAFIGIFHPLREIWNSNRLTRKPLIETS
jgi:hypothetical protein